MSTKLVGAIKAVGTAELEAAVASELKSGVKEVSISKLLDDIITDEEIEDIVEETTEIVNENPGRNDRA